MSALAILKAIAGIAEAGANIATGIMQNKETEAANKENLQLAEVTRQDTLKQQAESNKLARENLALSKQALEFNQEEAVKNREEALEEKGYNRLQKAANRFAEYLNYNNTYRQSKLSSILNR